MTEPKEDIVRIGVLRNVPYEPWKVHRHLVALCNQDGKFAIFDLKSMTDTRLERLLVYLMS